MSQARHLPSLLVAAHSVSTRHRIPNVKDDQEMLPSLPTPFPAYVNEGRRGGVVDPDLRVVSTRHRFASAAREVTC